MFVNFVIWALSVSVIGAQIFLVAGLIYFFLFPKNKESFLARFILKNSLRLGFIVALVAAAGSLFFSEVARFAPCELCWAQRIFMYPEVILLGMAWLRKDEQIIDYALSLAIIGTSISLYHNYVYYSVQKTAFCSATVPCTTPYVLEFGYITIPVMALTAFLLLTFLLGTGSFKENVVK